MSDYRLGILGAKSLVGESLLEHLRKRDFRVTAYTRGQFDQSDSKIQWRSLSDNTNSNLNEIIPHWICLAPIWVLPDYFSRIEAAGAKRIIALSSTSRFTKADSSDLAENAIAKKLIKSESQIELWAQEHGIQWIILRPTLIYGLGKDKNICEIARIIRRFGTFPLLGKASGLRQPVHAEDIAYACISALQAQHLANRAYNLSGKETLSYRNMVRRIAQAAGKPVRLLTVPLWIFRVTIVVLSHFPRYRHWSVAMVERMNRDLVFKHDNARYDFGFNPRSFAPTIDDVSGKTGDR